MDNIQVLISPGQGQVRYDKPPGSNALGKLFTVFLQGSIAIFAIALFWFAFVYYPKAVDSYKNIPLPVKQMAGKVSANFSSFPITTDAFRVTYEAGPGSYYIFVNSDNLAQFVEDKNSAILALKTALSLESVCKLNIFYVSTKKLDVPDSLKVSPNCQ